MENNLLNTINENDIQQTSVEAVSVGDTETGEEANYYEKNSLPQAPFDYDYSKKEHLNLSNGFLFYKEFSSCVSDVLFLKTCLFL